MVNVQIMTIIAETGFEMGDQRKVCLASALKVWQVLRNISNSKLQSVSDSFPRLPGFLFFLNPPTLPHFYQEEMVFA